MPGMVLRMPGSNMYPIKRGVMGEDRRSSRNRANDNRGRRGARSGQRSGASRSPQSGSQRTVPRVRTRAMIRKRTCATTPVPPLASDSSIPIRILMHGATCSLVDVFVRLTSARLPAYAIAPTAGSGRMPIGRQGLRIVPICRSEFLSRTVPTLRITRTCRARLIRRRRRAHPNMRLPTTLAANGVCHAVRRSPSASRLRSRSCSSAEVLPLPSGTTTSRTISGETRTSPT